MQQLTLIAVPVIPPGDNENEDTTVGIIDVPVGFRATDAIFNGQDVLVFGLVNPGNGVRVPHKVALLTLQQTIELPIGIKLGALLGTFAIPNNRGQLRPAQLFVYGVWPTSTLQGIATLGKA